MKSDSSDLKSGALSPDAIFEDGRPMALTAHREAETGIHALRRVYKAEFDADPGRYVLHSGFPDFPACGFGGAFSHLGFDTTTQVYVWFVKSILRDPRLARVAFTNPS